jgi:hypothetical protein
MMLLLLVPAVTRPLASTVTLLYVPGATPVLASATGIVLVPVPLASPLMVTGCAACSIAGVTPYGMACPPGAVGGTATGIMPVDGATFPGGGDSEVTSVI